MTGYLESQAASSPKQSLPHYAEAQRRARRARRAAGEQRARRLSRGLGGAGGTLRLVDAYLALVSKRDTRRYAEQAIPEAVVRRVLKAGRLAGSSRNRQPWRFVIVADPALRDRLAGLVYRPPNVRGAALVIALVVSGRGPVAFDAGRAAQNMMLAAWNDGVASCPNGLPDPAPVGELLGLGEAERVVIVLSFGFPRRARNPADRTPEAWAARADRRPLKQLAERL